MPHPITLFISYSTQFLSDDWIKCVKAGRFSNYRWDRDVEVQITTLDKLICDFGTPSFCKIDVEGFESNVLMGLSTPIEAVSFEFTSEFIQDAFKCIERLSTLGNYSFNVSLAETMEYCYSDWSSSIEIVDRINNLDRKWWGDVYAKMVDI